MTRIIAARKDPALSARVVSCWPLLYTQGPDPNLDRPAHVRAASSLALVGERLALVQDDAHFIALIDPVSRDVDSITLPAGPGGLRQFDDVRRTKHLKLDLEACLIVPDEETGRDTLISFGSGSKSARESIILVGDLLSDEPRIELFNAAELYRALRRTTDFAGSDLNIEGALYARGKIRLFGRGNGKIRDGLLPLDATCEIDWQGLKRHLYDPRFAPPSPEHKKVRSASFGPKSG